MHYVYTTRKLLFLFPSSYFHLYFEWTFFSTNTCGIIKDEKRNEQIFLFWKYKINLYSYVMFKLERKVYVAYSFFFPIFSFDKLQIWNKYVFWWTFRIQNYVLKRYLQTKTTNLLFLLQFQISISVDYIS